MPCLKKTIEKLPENLSMLDDLIRRCYRELLKNIEENAKLGDFIKMIELRRKLSPGDSDQREFWKMLERIRRETASDRHVKKTTRNSSRGRDLSKKNTHSPKTAVAENKRMEKTD
ncbi:MAG: hypothetical protein U9R56_01685 [candidate division Zixibacteria bacterium]|nr:hypothetical protein [candidate division Zixibacteria bacterium]